MKQWDKEPKDLDALVTARIPVRNNFDPRYFSDKYQVLPSKGYTKWFAEVLNHKNIDVVLGVDYFDVRNSLEGRCGKTIFTGPIDRYFHNANLGKLEYRSINFEAEIKEIPGFFQTKSVVNYPGPEVDFTRIVEYKHYFHQKSDYTVTVTERTTNEGDPYYPVPNPKNHKLYEKYQELAKQEEKEKNVYFVGRLASYKYFNMDAAIDNALDMFNQMEGHPKQPDIEDENTENSGTASTVSDSLH
jgi:UDP-galactopyranose mutase